MLLQSLMSQLPPSAARANGSSLPPAPWTSNNNGGTAHNNINNSNNSNSNGNTADLLKSLYLVQQRANRLQQELHQGLHQHNSQN